MQNLSDKISVPITHPEINLTYLRLVNLHKLRTNQSELVEKMETNLQKMNRLLEETKMELVKYKKLYKNKCEAYDQLQKVLLDLDDSVV